MRWYSIERHEGRRGWVVLDNCMGKAEAVSRLKEMRQRGVVSRGQMVRIEQIDPRGVQPDAEETTP